MKESDLAIFLHRTAYSDSSVIVSYFTLKQGFQKFFFRGAKKKSSSLFPLNIQEINYFRRPESDLGSLYAAESTMEVQQIPFDPVRSSVAYFLAEVLQKCLTHTECDEPLFRFLQKQIQLLDKANDLSLFPSQFLLQLTFYLGIQPQVVDGKGTEFHLAEGEFSLNAVPESNCSEEVTAVILDLLKGSQPQIAPKLRKEVLNTLLLYYKYHIESFGQLKTKEIVESVLH